MKILIIGDSCRDIFVYGKVERLSPDAPVPILIPHKRLESGGMASNVRDNILSLGAEADLVTNLKLITKTRYVEEKTNHQIVRVDSENTKIPRVRDLDRIQFDQYEAVIISDYNKGFLEYDDIEFVCSNHDIVFIDTKKIINGKFAKAKFIKINDVEYRNNINAGQKFDSFYEKLIITLGSQGAKYKDVVFPVEKVEIKDNSGAGDTFISGLVIEYCKTRDIHKAITFANRCATIVVQHKGITKVGNYL